MNLTGKFYEFYSKGLFDEDIYPDQTGVLINYDALTDSDKEVIVSNLDFKINKMLLEKISKLIVMKI